jgi:hypothetical protein
MKNNYQFKISLLTGLLMLTINPGNAQYKISFDASFVKNISKKANGLNLSCFWHFNEQLTGGIEVNRFFPVNKKLREEDTKLSAWDFDLNFHYLITVHNKLKFYLISGVSHTAEKEYIGKAPELKYIEENFWSFNTGAGILCECGKWSPHIEYTYTIGHIRQQFFLAGITYEVEWGHQSKEKNKAHHSL